MVFSSSIFLFFFLPLVIIGYHLLKESYRLHFLLLASLFFYAWGEPRYVLVMLASIVINYSFGMLIHKSRGNKSIALPVLPKIILSIMVIGLTGSVSLLFKGMQDIVFVIVEKLILHRKVNYPDLARLMILKASFIGMPGFGIPAFFILLHILLHNILHITYAKIFLILSIACNLGILFYFKYFNFALDTFNRFFHTGFAGRDIVLPIGISFFLFQGMSYVIDLYWQKIEVQKNPFKVAFYIAFFPQLMAGPIIRYTDIKEQLYKREESVEKFAAGAKRFVIGLAKKVIIANNLGQVADLVFANPALENTAATAWLGVVCYTFQIYFDFSGYSDMAIGLGKMFGFDFKENFNYPYISKSVTEFWRRWHISLSSWFKDYVYIPLGGNRKGNVYVNLFIVFVITGFWHGASFNFLVWGLWHGLALIVERLFGLREAQNRKTIPMRYAVTMLVVVTGWVFFRSPGLHYALSYLGVMFGFVRPENIGFTIWYYFNPMVFFMLGLAVLGSTPALKTAAGFFKIENNLMLRRVVSVLVIALFFVCIVFVTASSYNPFIYFRF